jgi:hypothetical protein
MKLHTDVKKSATACVGVAALATALIAGCGGGGGSAYGGPPAIGGNPSPSASASHAPSPSPSPSPSPTPQLLGTLNTFSSGTYPTYTGAAAASMSVVFSCGCTGQAGTGATNAGGSFTIATTSTATPAAPSPTYTIVPSRNYLVVAEPANGKGPQAWQLEFAGKTTAANLALSGSSATGVPASSSQNDVFAEAGALYVYFNSSQSATAFDDWNFLSVAAWVNNLPTGANAQEQQLLNDIAAAGAAGKSLFPAAPGWNSGQPINSTIATDLTNVKTSHDALLPTPCPQASGGGGAECTGTPTP